MAVLTQVVPPRVLSTMSERELDVVGGVVAAEIIGCSEIRTMLRKRIAPAFEALRPEDKEFRLDD